MFDMFLPRVCVSTECQFISYNCGTRSNNVDVIEYENMNVFVFVVMSLFSVWLC